MDSGDPQTDAFMAVLRAGGLFTNRVKSKFVEGHTDKCILCGQKDRTIHRIYECHQVHQARQDASWDLLQALPRQCLTWGLYPRAEEEEIFFSKLDAVEQPVVPKLRDEGQQLFLFTDGSCSRPPAGRKSERQASWAVRLAVEHSAQSAPLSAGFLPGRRQTAYRAELYAVTVAMIASTNCCV